jgi:hypothetical protein
MLANTCWVPLWPATPSQVAPSPPMCEMVSVLRPIITAIRWQPTPPSAQLPSGTLVEVLCGQPGQNQGVRNSVALGWAWLFALASRKAMWSLMRGEL